MGGKKQGKSRRKAPAVPTNLRLWAAIERKAREEGHESPMKFAKSVLQKSVGGKPKKRNQRTQSEAIPSDPGGPTGKARMRVLPQRFDVASEAGKIPDEADRKLALEALGAESDRGCVLMAQSLFDDALGCILYRHFAARCSDKGLVPKSTKETIRQILKSDNVARGFSQRMYLCFALGLIDDAMLDSFLDIREIRNFLAHQTAPFSLEKCDLEDIWHALPDELQQKLAMLQIIRQVHPDWKDDPRLENPNRKVFERTCIYLWFKLLLIAEHPDRVKEILANRPREPIRVTEVTQEMPDGTLIQLYSRSGAKRRSS